MSRLLPGDCLTVLPTLPADSVDSCVTDPPYGLELMGKHWDKDVPGVSFWREVYRVLKPGAHLLAFGGTRTYHRMVCAIEDAGFEIRDQIGWAYGSGFPKSKNVSLSMDKAKGHPNRGHRVATASRHHPDGTFEPNGENLPPYEAKSEDAKKWEGWGTALKPAWEPIVVARKPLSEKTVEANVRKWGTGAINIDKCRVSTDGEVITNHARGSESAQSKDIYGDSVAQETHQTEGQVLGRWPANLIHDGSDEVVSLFPDSKGQLAKSNDSQRSKVNVYGEPSDNGKEYEPRNDSGSAARFFYCAKTSKQDREEGCDELTDSPVESEYGNIQDGRPHTAEGYEYKPKVRKNEHPTVKPTELMRYLCRLVTPSGGTIIDPFMGSGSTGKAAAYEFFDFIGIEKEEKYMRIAEARIKHAENEAMKELL